MNEEIWKDIKGYEGLYQVSNMGNIKKGNTIKTPFVNNTGGYLRIGLYKNGKGKKHLVHRLVAQAFLPNPDNKPEVNHINTVRTDNRVWVNEDGSIDYDKSNLEWATKTENANNPLTKENYSTAKKGEKNGLYGIKGKEHHNSKPVIQFAKDGTLIRKWDCLKDVERSLGIPQSSISLVLKKKYKTAGGYIWKYYDIDTYLIGNLNNRLRKMA